MKIIAYHYTRTQMCVAGFYCETPPVQAVCEWKGEKKSHFLRVVLALGVKFDVNAYPLCHDSLVNVRFGSLWLRERERGERERERRRGH